MKFLTKKRKTYLTIFFSSLLILQQVAVYYGRTRSSRHEVVDENGNDRLAYSEINQLEELWNKAQVDSLLTLQTIGNPNALYEARTRLQNVERGIQQSQKRTEAVRGKKRDFFQKAYAYYRHAASTLIGIIDFLLANKDKYSVYQTEISFDNDSDADTFRNLVGELTVIHQEKKELDNFIANHNQEVEQSLKHSR